MMFMEPPPPELEGMWRVTVTYDDGTTTAADARAVVNATTVSEEYRVFREC